MFLKFLVSIIFAHETIIFHSYLVTFISIKYIALVVFSANCLPTIAHVHIAAILSPKHVRVAVFVNR